MVLHGSHFGLPSRLLDWTENALTALWFALSKLVPDKKVWRDRLSPPPGAEPFGDDAPVVWMMDPATLNRACFGPDEERIFFVGGEFSQYWLPKWMSGRTYKRFKFENSKYSNRSPMAIFPARRTPRIIAQQGVFTVHGFDKTPLEVLMQKHQPSGTRLARILVKAESVAGVWEELENVGVTRFGIFPDAENLVKKIVDDYW